MGGKRQVIKKELYKYLPNNFNNYIEPFIGGGSMLCFLLPSRAIINDVNEELIISYKIIKSDQIQDLMNCLDDFRSNHSANYYYKIRGTTFDYDVQKATRFIYLNKTSFNGMYRVNSKGKFNVPFNGKNKEKLNLYVKKNLLNWNNYLKNNNINIYNKNFDEILDMAREGDFVYCDPPYDYEENVNGFDSYTNKKFGRENQRYLAQKLIELDKKNVKWMLSNHNTNLINELYKDFNIINISTNRSINANGKKRLKSGNEVVVFNYEI